MTEFGHQRPFCCDAKHGSGSTIVVTCHPPVGRKSVRRREFITISEVRLYCRCFGCLSRERKSPDTSINSA